MTGNVVLLGVEALSPGAGRHWQDSYRHLTPILLFLFGVGAARALGRLLRNPYAVVLAVEIAFMAALAVLPGHTPDWAFTASIAFAASMQVQTFRSVNGRSYNSTFTTGNLRSLSVGVFDWVFGPAADTRREAREASGIFGIICGVFLLGAALGGLAVNRLGNRALLIEIALLLLVLWLVQNDRLLSQKPT